MDYQNERKFGGGMRKRSVSIAGFFIIIAFVFLAFTLAGNAYKLENECQHFANDSGYQKITVNFPQIYRLFTTESIEKTNLLLKRVAFSAWGRTYEEASIYIKGWQEGQNTSGAANIEYKVLYFSRNYFSVVFESLFMAGATSTTHSLVTIDLETGKYILLYDVVKIDKVFEAIRNGNFKVYEGTYSEFSETDAHEQDILDLMIQELETSLEEYPVEDGYSRYSSYNIGLDAEYLYLYVNLPNIAFHDYMILCIPLKDIVE